MAIAIEKVRGMGGGKRRLAWRSLGGRRLEALEGPWKRRSPEAGERSAAPSIGFLLTEGPVTLVPAPSSVAGIDEASMGLRIYQCSSSARLGSWMLHRGSRVLLSMRAPEAGDLVAIATRASIFLSRFEPDGPEVEGRRIGVVEGVISDTTPNRRRGLFGRWEPTGMPLALQP